MTLLWWVFRPLRFVAEMVRETTTPRQIAFGVALGMVAGLIPKASILAGLFGLSLLVFRVNLPAGLLATLGFSWASTAADRVADGFGEAALKMEMLQGFWTWLFQLSFAPWLRLNNTVVCGHVILAALLFYPTYHVSRKLCERYLPGLSERVQKYRLYRWLFSADVAATWRFE